MTVRLSVECYAGRVGDERPVRFRLNGNSYFVESVLDQWYGPDHLFFKVRADDDNVYILRHETCVPDGQWELVSSERAPPKANHSGWASRRARRSSCRMTVR